VTLLSCVWSEGNLSIKCIMNEHFKTTYKNDFVGTVYMSLYTIKQGIKFGEFTSLFETEFSSPDTVVVSHCH
jgi:hypothetical protein